MSYPTPMNVFLIGPGFIGEAVVQLLAQNAYRVTVLVRDQSAAARFSGREIKTVFATLDNSKIIEDSVFDHDIVIHTASSRHLASAMAVLAGIQRRQDAGHETIYIHTSGATHLADDSAGSFRGSTVSDDENPEQLNRLPDKESRVVDLAILRHCKTLGPNAKIAILTPPVVFGVGEGSGRLSIQLPTLVRYSLKHGYAGQIGRGLSVWNHIHVKDLARGYMEILKSRSSLRMCQSCIRNRNRLVNVEKPLNNSELSDWHYAEISHCRGVTAIVEMSNAKVVIQPDPPQNGHIMGAAE